MKLMMELVMESTLIYKVVVVKVLQYLVPTQMDVQEVKTEY